MGLCAGGNHDGVDATFEKVLRGSYGSRIERAGHFRGT